MSPVLNLQDIHALLELQAGLNGFSNNIREALQAGRSELNNRLESALRKMEERLNEMKKALEDVERAKERLFECSGVYGPDGFIPVDGMGELAELRYAESVLDVASLRVEKAQIMYERLLETAQEFTYVQQTIDRLANEHTGRAQAELSFLADRYASVHSGSISTSATDSGYVSKPKQSIVSQSVKIVNVPNLPAPEGISGSADFSKVSESDMRAGLQRLQEMRPVIERGDGSNSDYWADQDRQRGLGYTDGYQHIFDAFYGQDAIYVEKDGDHYDIINGRHRIWLAKQMGIDNLPMRVRER